MTSKLYVGFTGKAGAGKDYIADKLIERLIPHASTVRVPWAQGVRDEIEIELGTGCIERLHEKPTPYPIRRLLQWWGTDFRRQQDPDYWVNWGLGVAESTLSNIVFFTDTRFENEVDAIIRRGGIIINVQASEWTRVDRIGEVPSHASEELADLLRYDVRIDNTISTPDTDEAYSLIRRLTD
jgi:hypothetical protein